jgi:stage II sporulation SpoAA-like protein
MKSRWIRWKDHEVLYQDFTGCRSDLVALEHEVREVDALITRQPRGSVRALADLTDTTASAAAVQLFKASAMQTKPFIERQALIGIHGMKRYAAQTVALFAGQPMKVFDTRDAALDWLASAD